jgi:hypothetical protein
MNTALHQLHRHQFNPERDLYLFLFCGLKTRYLDSRSVLVISSITETYSKSICDHET